MYNRANKMNWYDYLLVPLYVSLFLLSITTLPILIVKIISLIKGLKEGNKELKYLEGDK